MKTQNFEEKYNSIFLINSRNGFTAALILKVRYEKTKFFID